MHRGIGLARFNVMAPSRAVHALYECCPSHTWASKIVGGRPFDTYAQLFRAAEAELFELSDADIEWCSVDRECLGAEVATRRTTLATVNRRRLERMLGPEDGYSY